MGVSGPSLLIESTGKLYDFLPNSYLKEIVWWRIYANRMQAKTIVTILTFA